MTALITATGGGNASRFVTEIHIVLVIPVAAISVEATRVGLCGASREQHNCDDQFTFHMFFLIDIPPMASVMQHSPATF
jgi:hypothetical protein